jgi:hypothetical protein
MGRMEDERLDDACFITRRRPGWMQSPPWRMCFVIKNREMHLSCQMNFGCSFQVLTILGHGDPSMEQSYAC